MRCKQSSKELIIVRDSRNLRAPVEAIPREKMLRHHTIVTSLTAKSTEDRARRRHQKACAKNPANQRYISPDLGNLLQAANEATEG
jgi:hypothetical protein